MLDVTSVLKSDDTPMADESYWYHEPCLSQQDFTQIRVISEGCHSPGPGKRMDDEGTDVGVAENSMEP
jgi:hypothetical protein